MVSGHHHHHHARDRTLVLRILVPSLREALRDKMAALEQKVAADQQDAAARQRARAQAQQAQASLGSMSAALSMTGGTSAADKKKATHVLDLVGVSCAPLQDNSTMWSFRCDGMTYPARLVNLPCPVEVHKTTDHATYHKCTDVGQILIVYEDMNHLEESEGIQGYKNDAYPSYYHSGLTPPMKRVVERRFAAREHKSVAPPRSEIAEVEKELKGLMTRVEKGVGKGVGKGKGRSPAAQGKPIVEEVDEIVDYEPWMDDNGRQPYGITFDEKDLVATKHPEIWLTPKDLREIQEEEEQSKLAGVTAEEAAAAESGKKAAAAAKKAKKNKDGTEKKKKKKKKKSEEAAAASSQEKHFKKGIPSLKTREAQAAAAAAAAANTPLGEIGAVPNDEVTQAAMMNMVGEGDDPDFLLDDDFFNFDEDDLGNI